MTETKQQREQDTDSEMSDSSEDEQTQRQRMLELLDARCSAMTGFSLPANTAAMDEEEGSDMEDDIEDEEEEEEEWTGFGQEDDETLDIQPRSSKGPIVVYDGSQASSSKRTLEDVALLERDNFMSSKIRHVPVETASSRKGKSRAKDGEDAAEEAHLASLDASLLSLLKDLPSSSKSVGNQSSNIASLLPSLTSLPNPRLLLKKDLSLAAPIDPRAPRQLREALYSSRLGRAQDRAASEKESGIISSGSNGFALTKKKRREQTGAEDVRRKKAKGLGGVVGKMRKGGAVLSLSREEVRRGNEGDFGGLKGRRMKGAPKGFSGGGAKGKGKKRH